MENQKYLEKLKEQFKEARQIVTEETNSPEFMKDFTDWLYKMRVYGDTLLKSIEDTGLYYDTPTCAEIGKGVYDSLVVAYDTTIITPYHRSFIHPRPSEGIILSDTFNIEYGVPTLTNRNNPIDVRVIKPEEINTYMMHNPYSDYNINAWKQLHNNPNTGIIFSVYGNTYDKDKDNKLKLLRTLKSHLLYEDATIEEDFTAADRYYHILATDIHAKKRKKSLR